MEVLSDQSILCRLKYKSYSVIQRFKISEFQSVKNRLPIGVRIEALSYMSNWTYGWSKLLKVDLIGKTTSYLTEEQIGIRFVVPNWVSEVVAVDLPYGFFDKRNLDIKEYILGISAIKDIEIELQYHKRGKHHKIDLEKLLKAKRDLYNITVKSNGYSFIHLFKEDFCTMMEDYSLEYNFNRSDVYAIHLGLKNGWLIPQAFSMYQDAKVDKPYLMPCDTSWIYQLLYSRVSTVFSISDYTYSLKGIRWKVKRNSNKKSSLVDIELKSSGAVPVLIDKNRAIRYVRK